MIGFLKKLFGGGDSADSGSGDVSGAVPDEIYKSIEIRANPQKAGSGQWRIAGTLTKVTDDEKIVRQFIRADMVSNRDEAVLTCISKAKLIIDQNGASVWKGNPDHPV